MDNGIWIFDTLRCGRSSGPSTNKFSLPSSFPSSRDCLDMQTGNRDGDDRDDPVSSRTKNTLLRRYLRALDERPVLTRTVVSAMTGALGGMLGTARHRSPVSGSNKQLAPRHSMVKTPSLVDWSQVLAFAVAGALVGGPMEWSWTKWLNEQGPESKSLAMILDQLVAQPPRILLTLMVADLTRASLVELPHSWKRSTTLLSPALATSWRFWPVVVYFLLSFLKKRKHYVVGMNACTLAWITYLVKQRRAIRNE